MVRHGGKICWGGSAIPPIPSKTETETLIQAANFVPSQAPFSPAPLENHYIAATGFAGKVIKFIPTVATAASAFFSNRWITKPGTAFYTVNCQVNAFTDSADVNNILFKIHTYSGSTPAGDYSTVPTASALNTIGGLGAYKMLRFNFQFTTSGDCYIIVVERQIDTNTGNIFVPNVLCYFNQALI